MDGVLNQKNETGLSQMSSCWWSEEDVVAMAAAPHTGHPRLPTSTLYSFLHLYCVFSGGYSPHERHYDYTAGAVLCCRVKADGGHGGKGGNVLVQADARCCIHSLTFHLHVVLERLPQLTADRRAFVLFADGM